jgi:hypothetical protein
MTHGSIAGAGVATPRRQGRPGQERQGRHRGVPAGGRARIGYWLRNEHYNSDEEFVYALADVLHEKYRAIVDSGAFLQVDDAVLMHEADTMASRGQSYAQYRAWARLRVEALNHALRGLPEDRIRYHVCFGSWHGPHDGKVLVPGVVTHHTNVVEHPELVAQRLIRLANVVGRDLVMGRLHAPGARGSAVGQAGRAGGGCPYRLTRALGHKTGIVIWRNVDTNSRTSATVPPGRT